MSEKLEITKQILKKYHQEHLLNFYEELSKEEQELLLNQLLEIDFKTMQELYEGTKKSMTVSNDKIEPIEYIDKEKMLKEQKEQYEKIGEEIITSGKYAVATMAGGQGTRLGHSGPKGTYYLVNNKSLFEIFYDELNKANQKYNVTIPWYIMTSRENNKETIEFFEKNNYFGYNKEYIKFFSQGELPTINKEGKILLAEKGLVKEAADGNGGIFSSMNKNGIIDDMIEKQVEWLFIGAIDNALLKMVDPLLVGIAHSAGVLAAAKSLVKCSPTEKVGVFCKKNNQPSVIEYTELPEKMANLRDENGELFYGESHIMCNMFHVDVLKSIGERKLPYHQAFKKINYINEKGEKVEASEPNAYKFESFIFDAFETIPELKILRVKREEEFAPVKNATGVDSPETARELYLNYIKNKK